MPVEIIGILNTIFNPLLAADPNPTNPALTILVIAFIVSLLSNIANRYLVNQERVSEIQNKVKSYNDKLREAQQNKNDEKLLELQDKQPDILKLQSEMMMNTFKPLIVTYLPIILMFSWMQSSAVNSTVVILPQFVYWLTLTPLWQYIGSIFYGGHATIAFGIGWLLWYMICSFGFNQVLKKYLGNRSVNTLKT